MEKVARKDDRPPSLPLAKILPACRSTKTMPFHQLSRLSLNTLPLGSHVHWYFKLNFLK